MGILNLFQTDETVISYVDEFTKFETEFTLDVCTAIDTTVTAKVTDFPVEGGGNITDHVQAGPRMLTLTGLISISPSNPLLVLTQALAAGAASQLAGGGLGGTFAAAAGAAAVSGLASQLNNGNISSLLAIRNVVDPDYPKRAMKGLIFMLEAGQRFTVRTYMSADLYTDMVFTSCSFKNDAKRGDSLPFVLNCKQVKTVSAFGALPIEVNMKAPAGSSAATAVSGGAKAGKATTGASQTKGKTFLIKLLGG
jgi:hypothetical protein